MRVHGMVFHNTPNHETKTLVVGWETPYSVLTLAMQSGIQGMGF